ncbi:AEC family transporter [Bacillus sp. DTU_2020_1000418_1_SI_GHA_SEK_038]|uniref:AEC family transporter n=1 Tax=Bacillus sp. DTU_2020_1000418_1_SI_GHA_SEK_038 TaxID=3077585 RepID=UPI0028EAC3BE|nr:AEC family transporter [Bacillus sp. DTU_2020_1000418_1_SI_GHA_SEK_038]WNS76501.1 AEC family transporter [Bacillus sp. DTU_2020_1000418_1_SI_GHA_SEK_038]
MDSIGVFLHELLTLYGIAILGFIASKSGILNENANDVLTQLILYITLPALILFSLDISFSYTLVKEFLTLIAMSVYILGLSSLLAFWMRRRSQLLEKQKSVYEGLIIFGNQGFIGYAVIFIVFGNEGIIYLTMFNLCYLLLIWSYGIYLFSKNNNVMGWKNIFLNPGILSTIAGLAIFLLPIGWPRMVSNGLEMVGKMTIPLSMIIIGSLIANVKYMSLVSALKNSSLWKMAIAKLLLIPLLLIPFAALSVPTSLLLIAVIVSGMPSAPTISLYAQKYGADAFFASLGVLLTTLLCIMTIPFLYLVVDLLTH